MWHKDLESNRFISSLYQEIPELINVSILAIKIKEEGRRVTITFNMPMFADNAPLKWKNSGYNAVLVEIDFFDILEFNMSYSKEYLRGTIKIEKNEEDKFKVTIFGTVNMNMIAEIGIIQSVKGYINELYE